MSREKHLPRLDLVSDLFLLCLQKGIKSWEEQAAVAYEHRWDFRCGLCTCMHAFAGGMSVAGAHAGVAALHAQSRVAAIDPMSWYGWGEQQLGCNL